MGREVVASTRTVARSTCGSPTAEPGAGTCWSAPTASDRPCVMEPLVEEMQDEVGEALESLRALARGVYPPLLEAEGLRRPRP